MKILIFHADQYGTAIMVVAAAIASGVASQTIKDFDAYCHVWPNSWIASATRPVFLQAENDLKRMVYAEGKEIRLLRAGETVVDEKLTRPILIGRPKIIDKRI